VSSASIQNVRVVTPGGIVDRDILVDETGVIRELVERGTVVPDATTTDGHGC
jgi:dihydroorotase-like cyclic amidohydrolase